jgi:hypothetical protein
LIAAPGSGYGSNLRWPAVPVPSQQRAAEPCARPTCGSSAYSLSSGRTRTGDTVSANGSNWISGGAGGVCSIWADISLSVTTMARRGRSRRGGGPFHAKSTPARSEKPRPGFRRRGCRGEGGRARGGWDRRRRGTDQAAGDGALAASREQGTFQVPQRSIIQFNKVSANGRLLRWPPFAKGSLSGSWIGFRALLAYGGYYRALEGGATIPGDRPVRPDRQPIFTSCVRCDCRLMRPRYLKNTRWLAIPS